MNTFIKFIRQNNTFSHMYTLVPNIQIEWQLMTTTNAEKDSFQNF